MALPDTVLEYIQALKWPVLVGGALIWERNAIKRAIDRFRMPDEGSLKVPGFGDLAWRNAVKEVAAKSEEVKAAIIEDRVPTITTQEANLLASLWKGYVDIGRGPSVDEWDQIDRSVITDPTGAVMTAWTKVEGAMLLAAERQGGLPGRPGSFRSISRILDYVQVSPDLRQVILELRDLRNRAAHGQTQISSEGALDYVQTAKRVVYDIYTVDVDTGRPSEE